MCEMKPVVHQALCTGKHKASEAWLGRTCCHVPCPLTLGITTIAACGLVGGALGRRLVGRRLLGRRLRLGGWLVGGLRLL